MKKILILLPLIIFLYGCKEVECTEQIHRGYRYLREYYYTDNEACLDSVSDIISHIEVRCPDMQYEIHLLKSELYCTKREWENAIAEIEKMDIIEFPQKNMFISKLRIEEALQRDDNSAMTLYPEYKTIIAYYDNYIDENEQDIIKKVRGKNVEKIENSPIDKVFMDYFHYKLQLTDIETIFKEIDSIQVAMNGNLIYFDMLKHRLEKGWYKLTFDNVYYGNKK